MPINKRYISPSCPLLAVAARMLELDWGNCFNQFTSGKG